MTATLGLVTIGQAPRVDLIPDVADTLAGIDIVEHGALNFLDPAEIAGLFPKPGTTPLVSRLRNGDSAVMGHHAVVPFVNDAIERCVLDGADALLLCTGHFSGVKARVPLFFAELLSHLGTAAIVGDDILGVM